MPTGPRSDGKVKLADEVWIAAALLHREHPESLDFSIEEIVERAATKSVASVNRPGVYVHVVQHCVANRPPNPAREGAKITPSPEEMAHGYEGLLSWYRDWSSDAAKSASRKDPPLLALAESGARIWSGEHADEYVRRWRQGWE